jgi:hypothetical protein
VRLGTLGLATAIVCAVASPARAEESATIVIVERLPSPALAARLQAELETLGFQVRRRTGGKSLESWAMAERAVAAVGIDRSLELFIVDTDTGKPAIRERISLDASDVAAVTASETVRARLLHVGVTPASSRPRAEAPSPVSPPPALPPPERDEPVQSTSVDLRVWTAGGIHHAPGGLGPLPEASAGTALKITRGLGLELAAGVTLDTARVAELEGHSDVRFYRADLTLLAHFELGPATFTTGPGCGIVLAEMAGDATAPLQDRTTWVKAATPALTAGFRVPVAGSFGLRAQGALGLSIPRIVVRFDRREVGDWGRPFALLGLGPEFTFH